jgi:hypothetical protein
VVHMVHMVLVLEVGYHPPVRCLLAVMVSVVMVAVAEVVEVVVMCTRDRLAMREEGCGYLDLASLECDDDVGITRHGTQLNSYFQPPHLLYLSRHIVIAIERCAVPLFVRALLCLDESWFCLIGLAVSLLEISCWGTVSMRVSGEPVPTRRCTILLILVVPAGDWKESEGDTIQHSLDGKERVYERIGRELPLRQT